MKHAFLCVLLVLASCVFSLGQTYKVLYSFGTNGGSSDGRSPISSLIFDSSGNLYGTTIAGGKKGYGIAFKLSPQPDGSWTETILHEFCTVSHFISCLDGLNPQAGLVLDAQGNLYGTANGGSKICSGDLNGCGVVYELSPPSVPGAEWTEKILYNFCSVRGMYNVCLDGKFPYSQLVFDSVGNLYGTTTAGGSGHVSGGAGTVFELSPGANGWTEAVLYNFCSQGMYGDCPDGVVPYAGVTFGPSGNLYGTTSASGQICCGAGLVYELSPSGDGWLESTVFEMSMYRSGYPLGVVSFDSSGNLYTTAAYRGKDNGGSVMMFDPVTGKGFAWPLQPAGNEGPTAGVLIDSERKTIYGTVAGGSGNVFQIDSQGALSNLYVFCSDGGQCTDGASPRGSLIEDSQGNLYGTASAGGSFNYGVVFEITP